MAPKLNLFTANKAASALRQPSAVARAQRGVALPLRLREQSALVQKRWNSSQDKKKGLSPDKQKFPTQDPMPHVNEEAAAMDRIMNKEKWCDGQASSPELEQGSPVADVSGLPKTCSLLDIP